MFSFLAPLSLPLYIYNIKNISALPFPPREFADRGTKWLLGHPPHLRHLLYLLLGPDCDRIDFQRLQPVPNELLSECLRRQLADLVFLAPFRQPQQGEVMIFILVEQQTTVSPAMRMRVLSYMVQLWDRQRQQWERDRRPETAWRFHSILPVVFYTGNVRWTNPWPWTSWCWRQRCCGVLSPRWSCSSCP